MSPEVRPKPMCRPRRSRAGWGRRLCLLAILYAGTAGAVAAAAPGSMEAAWQVADTNLPAALRLLEGDARGPVDPARALARGHLLLRAGALAEAEAACREALAADPAYRPALLSLGRVLLRRERPEEAVALYRQGLEAGPPDADLLRLLGHALLLGDAPVSAEAAYRQSLFHRPRDPLALEGLGQALVRQARYAEAAALLQDLLARRPAAPSLWTLRVEALRASGQPAAALRSAETARRLGAAEPSLLAVLGDLWLERGQPEEAVHAYEAAFEADGLPASRILRAGEAFLHVGDPARAARMLAWVEAQPAGSIPEDDISLRIRRGRLQAALARMEGRRVDAEARCREVLRLDPLDGDTLLLLGQILLEGAQFEEAVLTCERAARQPGFEVDALLLHARAEVARGRLARALEILEAARAFEDRPDVTRMHELVRRMAESMPVEKRRPREEGR